jgi:hypothetical protein
MQVLLYPASDRDNDVSVATSGPGQKAHALLLNFLTKSLGTICNRDDGYERATQNNGKKNKDEEAVQHWYLLVAIRIDCLENTQHALNPC